LPDGGWASNTGCFHFQSNELSVAVFLISHQITLLPKWKRHSSVYAHQLFSGDFWKRACWVFKRQDFDRSPSMATAMLQNEIVANLGDFWNGLVRTFEMLKTM
jgi:hypothetical protein